MYFTLIIFKNMLNSLLTTENFFYTIIALVIFEFLLTKTLGFLNTRNWSDKLPKELEEIYDQDKYSKSMKYEKSKYKL